MEVDRRIPRRPDVRRRALGETFVAFASAEMVVPAGLAGMAPVATGEQIVLVLGDFRGDVWMPHLT